MKRAGWILIVLGMSGSAVAWAADAEQVPQSAPRTAAQSGAYLGADIAVLGNTLEYHLCPSCGKVQESYSSTHLRLRAGYRFTSQWAIEAHVVSGSDDTQVDPYGNTFRMTTGPIVGVFGRVNLPLGQQAGIYGLLGVSSVQTKYKMMPNGTEDSQKSTKVGFGGGLEVYLAERLRASADFMMYMAGDASYPSYFGGEQPKQAIGGFSFGLTYYF